MLAAKPYLKNISIRQEGEQEEGVDFGEYPFSIPAIQKMGELELPPDVTFFVDENGAGKSTLL